MKSFTTLVIAALSFLTTPTLADTFLCPVPEVLPAALNLSAANPASVQPVQAYLSNLRRITAAYRRTGSRGQRNELTNCLMDHLVTLPDSNALQNPQTRADGATWFLLHAEVATALQIHRANLAFKPQLPFIVRWLNATPRYLAASPYTVATR